MLVRRRGGATWRDERLKPRFFIWCLVLWRSEARRQIDDIPPVLGSPVTGRETFKLAM